MSTISLRLPQSLHQQARELAKKEGVSINQLVTLALAEKISSLMTEDYLGQRAKRGRRKKFEARWPRRRTWSPRRKIDSNARHPPCT